jgi:peptidyl-dipeptidase Dcp
MTNPFFAPWTTPFEAPPFDAIATEHFKPAYTQALEAHQAEVAGIAESAEEPSFENTIAALERSGKPLRRVDMVFNQLGSANTNDELQAVELEMAPVVARHWNGIFLNPKLFARIDALYQRRGELGLSGEEARVLERYHLDFVRSGAALTADERQRYAAITERLAVLGTQFGRTCSTTKSRACSRSAKPRWRGCRTRRGARRRRSRGTASSTRPMR